MPSLVRAALRCVAAIAVLSSLAFAGFHSVPTYPVGSKTSSQPFGITTGDFNGDGLPDIATANSNDASISVLLAKTGGRFAPAVNYDAPRYANAIKAADLNQDGALDLVIVNTNADFEGFGTMSIYLGKGDGTFEYLSTTEVQVVPIDIIVSDVNGDGAPDILVLNEYGSDFRTAIGSVSVLLGNGDATFQPASIFEAGTIAMSFVSGDFNHDGKLDLAVTNHRTKNNTIGLGIFSGHGDGTFELSQTYLTPEQTNSVAAGDVNNDGILDLVTSDAAFVSVYLGQADGTFVVSARYGLADYSITRVWLADVSGDGNADIVAACGYACVMLGRGDGTFHNPMTYPTGAGATGIAIADFSQDGSVDLATANTSGGSVSLLFGNGGGIFSSLPLLFPQQQTFSITTGDFTGDGLEDLVVAKGKTGRPGSVTLLPGIPGTGFGAAISVPFNIGELVSADFNRDGILDLAGASGTDSSEVGVLLGRGHGAFRSGGMFPAGSTAPSTINTGDFNHDGAPDLVITSARQSQVTVLLNDGSGALKPPLVSATTFAPTSLAVADLNQDGADDVIVGSNAFQTGVNLAVYLNNGDGTFSPGPSFALGDEVTQIGAADLNNDGKVDVIATELVGGSYQTTVMLGNGDGTLQPGFKATNAGGVFTIGDADLDGNLDLAVSSFADATLTVFYGNGQGGFAQSSPSTIGNLSSFLLFFHYSRDKYPDLLSFSTGVVEVTNSGGR